MLAVDGGSRNAGAPPFEVEDGASHRRLPRPRGCPPRRAGVLTSESAKQTLPTAGHALLVQHAAGDSWESCTWPRLHHHEVSKTAERATTASIARKKSLPELHNNNTNGRRIVNIFSKHFFWSRVTRDFHRQRRRNKWDQPDGALLSKLTAVAGASATSLLTSMSPGLAAALGAPTLPTTANPSANVRSTATSSCFGFVTRTSFPSHQI